MDKQGLIQHIAQRWPYVAQISQLDMDTEKDAIRFDWRGTRFRVSHCLGVEEVGDGVLAGSNLTIALGALLRRG